MSRALNSSHLIDEIPRHSTRNQVVDARSPPTWRGVEKRFAPPSTKNLAAQRRRHYGFVIIKNQMWRGRWCVLLVADSVHGSPFDVLRTSRFQSDSGVCVESQWRRLRSQKLNEQASPTIVGDDRGLLPCDFAFISTTRPSAPTTPGSKDRARGASTEVASALRRFPVRTNFRRPRLANERVIFRPQNNKKSR